MAACLANKSNFSPMLGMMRDRDLLQLRGTAFKRTFEDTEIGAMKYVRILLGE